MATLTINDAELHYETRGDPANPSLLALHGGPGIGDGSKPLAALEPLAEQYYLVAPDHRGCGRSEQQKPYTNEQFAADAAAMIRELELGPVAVYGGSYGGFIAQQLAIDHPASVAALVFRDTAATPAYDIDARETARDRLPEVRERDIDVPHITDDELSRVMDGTVESNDQFRRLFHGMLPLYAPSLDAFDADAAADRIDEIRFHYQTHNQVFSEVFPAMDYTDDLPDVSLPAFVTVGRHDWITPVEASEQLVSLLPNARLRIFEQSGHNPHIDQSNAWLAEVRAFLDNVGYR